MDRRIGVRAALRKAGCKKALVIDLVRQGRAAQCIIEFCLQLAFVDEVHHQAGVFIAARGDAGRQIGAAAAFFALAGIENLAALRCDFILIVPRDLERGAAFGGEINEPGQLAFDRLLLLGLEYLHIALFGLLARVDERRQRKGEVGEFLVKMAQDERAFIALQCRAVRCARNVLLGQRCFLRPCGCCHHGHDQAGADT